MTLGTKIALMRRDKNLTQTQVADKLGVSQNAYNKWESGKAKPSMENLMKVAEFYDKDIYELCWMIRIVLIWLILLSMTIPQFKSTILCITKTPRPKQWKKL